MGEAVRELKPQALFEKIVAEVLEPMARTGTPMLDGYVPEDISSIWDFGPIGYEGDCWRERETRFHLAKYEGRSPWVGIAVGMQAIKFEQFRWFAQHSDELEIVYSQGRHMAHFAYRKGETCVLMSVEVNYDNTALVFRWLPILKPVHARCSMSDFDVLYPERDMAAAQATSVMGPKRVRPLGWLMKQLRSMGGNLA